MAGVKRCGVKVTPEGKPDETTGKPCALKFEHTGDHKPRIAAVVSADDITALTGSITVVTDTAAIIEARRTRTVSDSPLAKLATTITQGAYDAWVRGGKKTEWEEI